MASQIVRSNRVITYLPSLRSAVIRARAFSSGSDSYTPDPSLPDFTDDRRRDRETVWPDQILGPLGPQDKRFPMPGLVGPCVNTYSLAQHLASLPGQHVKKVPDPEVCLPQLPEHRHFDIAEQFLTSVDEIEVEFVDDQVCTPTAEDTMEYRANACPEILRKEFNDLFPDRNLLEGQLTIVNISLKTEHEMSMWSSEVESEREALLDTFVTGALDICKSFEDAGFWADFIDPSSGKPFKGPHTNFTLFETDERYRKLGFDIMDLGCCKVISHPVWGTRAYIGSLFTNAPLSHPLIKNLNQGKC